MIRDQFTFYRSFWVAMQNLPKKDRFPFVEAICAYVFEGEVRQLSGGAAAAFSLVSPVLDTAAKKAGGGKHSWKIPQAQGEDSGKIPRTQGKDSGKEKEKEREKELEQEGEDECPPPGPPPGGGRRSRQKTGNIFAEMLREGGAL